MTPKTGAGPRKKLIRLYRTLLLALPARFRKRNQDELAAVVTDLIREAERANGLRGALRCFLDEALDILKTSVRLRFWTRSIHPPSQSEGDHGMAIDSFLQDVRLAGRGLRKNPGFATVVILTLAVGVGATTAIFSVVNRALLQPLPFGSPERLVMVWENDRLTGTQREASSVPDYFDFVERNQSFADMAAFAQVEMNLTASSGEPRRLQAAQVTANLAKTLGIKPAMGRMISADEDAPGGKRTVLLSDAFWRSALGGDPAAIGQTLALNDQRYTIIGILPPGLSFPDRETDVWTPLQQGPNSTPRHRHWITVAARLNPGATIQQAQADMTAITAQLEREYSENRARGAFVEPLGEIYRGSVRPALLALFGAVLIVLLITCVNVAGLQLARAADRSRELAVQSALGASLGRLLQKFVVEGLIVAAAASAIGLALAILSLQALAGLVPAEARHLGSFQLDFNVFLFGLALSAAVAVSFGLAPALQARRLDLNSALQEGRGEAGGAFWKTKARQLLVVSQLAMALSLLVGAGLLINSLQKLQMVDLGFRPENVLRLDYQLPPSRYPRDFSVWPNWSEVHNFNRELLHQVRALPGVKSAALTTNHPLDEGFTNSFVIVGRESESANQGELKTRLVSEGYFQTAGVQLVEGRVFTDRDATDSPPVLLLNREAVRRYFPANDAMGSRIRLWGSEREIVGLVGNEKMHGLREETPPAMYLPIAQAPPVGTATLMLRTAGDPQALLEPARSAVWAIDRELAVFNVFTMEETVLESLSRERFLSTLLALFAGLAVLLAALGVHGVLSYMVAQRRREVGVRMALGASRAAVLRMILRQGAKLAALGVVLGLTGAFLLAPLLSSLLYGVGWAHPATYLIGSAALVVAALLACAIPAWRAARIDPATALRTE